MYNCYCVHMCAEMSLALLCVCLCVGVQADLVNLLDLQLLQENEDDDSDIDDMKKSVLVSPEEIALADLEASIGGQLACVFRSVCRKSRYVLHIVFKLQLDMHRYPDNVLLYFLLKLLK